MPTNRTSLLLSCRLCHHLVDVGLDGAPSPALAVVDLGECAAITQQMLHVFGVDSLVVELSCCVFLLLMNESMLMVFGCVLMIFYCF